MYDPQKHHRKSIRMKGYDYTQHGLYFVTIFTQDRKHLFGAIENQVFTPSPAGEMIIAEWEGLQNRFPSFISDTFTLLPNHCHGILSSLGENNDVALGSVIGAFKSITTNKYSSGVREMGWPNFNGRLWHRNFWEHIIRNKQELETTRTYIHNNVASWKTDELNI